MKMKNKLVKFNHKKGYYTLRKCAITFAIFAGLGLSAAVPVTVSLMDKAPVAPHAEETTIPDVDMEQEATEEVENIELQEY